MENPCGAGVFRGRPLGYLRGGGRLQRGHGIRPHQGASLAQAALLGNACSSIVIKQIGVTGTAKLGDAWQNWKRVHKEEIP